MSRHINFNIIVNIEAHIFDTEAELERETWHDIDWAAMLYAGLDKDSVMTILHNLPGMDATDAEAARHAMDLELEAFNENDDSTWNGHE